MADELPFLRAIAAAPADDGPRLAFADWLDEHGDAPRAEFIRAQCALAGLDADDPRRAPLKVRADALLAAHEADSRRPLDGLDIHKVTFDRGLPDGVLMRGRDFVRHSAVLFARAPTVRRLWVTLHGDEELRALAVAPGLADLDALTLSGSYLPRAGLRDLLAAPALARLTGFGIEASDLEVDTLDALPACGAALPHLRTLRLPINGLGNRAAAALAATPDLAGLTRLDLGANFLGHRGARALADAPYLAGLEALDLSHNPLDERGTAAIVGEASQWWRLQSLGLKRCRVGDEGATILAGTPRLAELRRLDLRDNGITDAGALALVRSPHLGAVCGLDLANVDPITPEQTNRIGPGARRALVERFGRGVRF